MRNGRPDPVLRTVDYRASTLHVGDIVAVATNNSGIRRGLPGDKVRLIAITKYPIGPVSTMSAERGAGFYSSLWGSLPYVIGKPQVDSYLMFEVVRQIDF